MEVTMTWIYKYHSREMRKDALKEKLKETEVYGYELENWLVFRVNEEGHKQLYVPYEWENNREMRKSNPKMLLVSTNERENKQIH